MKREKILPALVAAALTFCLGFGGAACMVTGLNLTAPWFWLFFGCAFGAAAAVTCLCFKRGGWLLLGAFGLWALVLLGNDDFVPQFQSLVLTAVNYYNFAYGVPIPNWELGVSPDSQLLPLLLISGVVMFLAAWIIMGRKPAPLALLVAALPLASCLVVTDTVPSLWAVSILLMGMILFMLTQSTRRQDGPQGDRLTVLLTLPVAVGLVLLFCLVPRGNYAAPEQGDQFQKVLSWLTQVFPFLDQDGEGNLVLDFGNEHKEEVDLEAIGQRVEKDTPVMAVTADFSGKVYLRGRDYDKYDGNGWSAIVNREEHFDVDDQWLDDAGQLVISTEDKRGEYYLPYYATEGQPLLGGRKENAKRQTDYSYSCAPLRPDWKNQWIQYWYASHRLDYLDTMWGPADYPNGAYGTSMMDVRYLTLPKETRQRAEAVLYQQFPQYDPSPLSLAQEIGEYVSRSASYDLNPGKMPSDETDFAMWFLEEQDKGYCVHFASAATVLLRAAGIPARYVEGYTFEVTKGETVTVRERMAHAWTEYYLEGLGWVVLDATPGGEESPQPTTPETRPTETKPAETEPEETEPSESVMPTQPSEPEDDTEMSTQTPPQQGTGGTGPANSSDGKKALPGWFIAVLWTLAVTAVLVTLTIAQWILRRRKRLKRMYDGKPNAQALARYREAKYVARIGRFTMPPELKILAEKARFSQHTLSKEELAQFDAFLRESVEALQRKPWYRRIIYRIIFAVY